MWDTEFVLGTLLFIDAFLIGPPCIFVQLQTLPCPGNAVSMIFILPPPPYRGMKVDNGLQDNSYVQEYTKKVQIP